jgi:hypothetical protein
MFTVSELKPAKHQGVCITGTNHAIIHHPWYPFLVAITQ